MEIKSYTDLEQSMKLAEILPLKSADMHYPLPCSESDIPVFGKGGFGSTPCWSLAALLDVLPKQIGRYTKTLYWFDDAWHCEYVDEDSEGKYGVTADNCVDACVKMIIKLKENNLL
jgi:hypothetical protein